MLNSLRGRVTEKGLDFIRIDTMGIEWDVSVPSTAVPQLPEPGQDGRLLVWLLHREDQMKLFGFADEAQRTLFMELQKVEGIGPRQAMKILSGIRTEDLVAALDLGDLGRLEAVPGLGKKTAQKMVLALKGKLAEAEVAAGPVSAHAELVGALADMGYDRKLAAAAVAEAEREAGDGLATERAEREQQLFKRAIVILSRG